jgi:hypothetical protein
LSLVRHFTHSKLSGVMMRGQWYPGPELQRRLKIVHDRPGNYRVRN